MDRKFQTVSASSDVRNDQNTGFEECHDCNMNQTLQKLKHHSKMCLHNAPATDARARSKRSLFKPCCAHINHVNKNTKADDDELLSHTVFSTQETAVGGQLEDKNVEEKLEIASSMTNVHGPDQESPWLSCDLRIPCTSFPELRTVCSVSSAPIWSAHCPQHHG